jgi:hypothetical protein
LHKPRTDPGFFRQPFLGQPQMFTQVGKILSEPDLVRTGFGFACRHWHSFAKPAAAEHATSSRVDTLSPRNCFAPFRAPPGNLRFNF